MPPSQRLADSTEVIEEPVTILCEYAGIPITFEVREVLDVIADAEGSLSARASSTARVIHEGLRRDRRQSQRNRQSGSIFRTGDSSRRSAPRSASVGQRSPATRRRSKCSRGGETWRCSGTFEWRPWRAAAESVRPCSMQRSRGPARGVAFNSRSRLRTSTWPPAASMRNGAAYFGRFTRAHIHSYRTKFSSSGSRTSAVGQKPASTQIYGADAPPALRNHVTAARGSFGTLDALNKEACSMAEQSSASSGGLHGPIVGSLSAV